MAEIPVPGPTAPPPHPENASQDVKRRSRESVWGLRKPLTSRWRLPFAVAMPALVILTWCILTLGSSPILNELFLPSPLKVLQATLGMLFEGSLWPNIWAAGARIFISFFAAALVALPLGILMGAFEPINRLMEPV